MKNAKKINEIDWNEEGLGRAYSAGTCFCFYEPSALRAATHEVNKVLFLRGITPRHNTVFIATARRMGVMIRNRKVTDNGKILLPDSNKKI
jgi:hypothetical protein